MKLADLDRPSLRSRMIRDVAIALAIFFAGLSSWLAADNRTLIQTNAELAHYVTQKLDSLEVELNRVVEVNLATMDALYGAEPRVE